MSPRVRWVSGALAVVLALSAAWTWWHQRPPQLYLSSPPAEFAALFAPPPAADSAATRAELDELLAIQATRTSAQEAAAQYDRRTEVDRFYSALGLDPERAPSLPRLQGVAEDVEDEVRVYVRAAKDRYRRLRPYEIEPRLDPCIGNVAADLSYPSGHAAYAWSMAYLLSDMVPERRDALLARAAEFARQRVVCGVHFPSDLEAGKWAAGWLLEQMLEFHRREDKAVWWEFYRLAELPSDDVLDEPSALGGLELVARIGGTKRGPVDRYRFPPQELTRPRGEVRSGTGVLAAVQFASDALEAEPALPGRAVAASRENGILTRALGIGALQVSPPLVIDAGELNELREGLRSALDAVSSD